MGATESTTKAWMRTAKTIVGALCLAATLALMSPGVRVVRADDAAAELVSAAESGPVSEVLPPAARGEVASAPHRGRRARRASRSRPRMLNNSGYNYGPGSLEALRLPMPPPPTPEPRR